MFVCLTVLELRFYGCCHPFLNNHETFSEKQILFKMEEEEQNVEKHFIGLDLSTQQIKAVVIDENLQV